MLHEAQAVDHFHELSMRVSLMTPSPNSLTGVLASTMTNKDGPQDSRVNPNPVQLPGSSSLQNYIGNRRFFKESERLKTFERWPVSFLSPRTMTEAGFYYINRDDIVRCAFCNIEVGRWVEGDDPMADHERWAPACRFVRHQDVNNVPIGEEGSTSGDSGSESLEGFDVCGHGMEFQTESQRPASLLETHEGYLKSRAPCFANYATLDARLRSYDTWPISLKLKPNVLSDAGFFYTGKGDQTICYHCGGGLKDWEETDEPWVEHARWFSKCPYVLAVKGKSFIEEVNGSRAVQDVTQNGNIGLSSSTGDLDKVPSVPVEEKVKKTTSEPVKTVGDSSRPKEDSQSAAPSHDGRLCKICFSEEMGAVFLPCGHIVACVKCAVSLTTCAICRQPVTGTFRAFLS
uniref:Apoptosis inhibitor IAP n=4 Tax=Lygus TaxID=30084 RepID=A0A146LQQ7_LYGHE